MGAGSAAARGAFEALFSEATMDNGRLLEPVDPRDEGRCCHESVPAREGAIAALGEGAEIVGGLNGGCGSSRGRVSDPRSLTLAGAPSALRAISSGPEGPDGGGWKDGVLEKSFWLHISISERLELGEPALEDVFLVGEIDLARSVRLH